MLDWNAPAIAFYRSLGAVGMDGWTTQRVAGERWRGWPPPTPTRRRTAR